jgi:hypothetical protein
MRMVHDGGAVGKFTVVRAQWAAAVVAVVGMAER